MMNKVFQLNNSRLILIALTLSKALRVAYFFASPIFKAHQFGHYLPLDVLSLKQCGYFACYHAHTKRVVSFLATSLSIPGSFESGGDCASGFLLPFTQRLISLED